MKLEIEGDWNEIQEVCRRICGEKSAPKTLDDELLLMIAKDDRNGMLSAIKYFRTKTGAALKDARDHILALKAEHHL